MRDRADNPFSALATPSVFCSACGSPLVQAVEWTQTDDSCWDVKLWCPDCKYEQEATLARSELLYLSRAIEEGFVWMLDALSELDALPSDPSELDFADRAQTDRLPPARR